MKYGITEQLRADDAEKAQRFHAAMLRRLFELQKGADIDLCNPLDVALTMLAVWDAQQATQRTVAHHPV